MRERVHCFLGDQPAPQRLVNGLLDQILVYMAGLEQIQNRSQRTRSSNAMHVLDVAVAEIGSVNIRISGIRLLRRKCLGTVMCSFEGMISESRETYSGVVTVGALSNFLTILRPKIPEHEIGAFRSGKSREPIDSTVLPDPVSHLNMVSVGILGNTRADCLFGRKKPC